jgi:hypothetical protein
MNHQKLSKRPSASNHTIQKHLLRQELELKGRAIEATDSLLRITGMSEQVAGNRATRNDKLETMDCLASESETANAGCFAESLGAFTTRESFLQMSNECLEAGSSLVNLQAPTTKFETLQNFNFFDGEEELPELLEKQDLLFSEDRQSEDHINSSLSEESLIMEFEAQGADNTKDAPKESSLEGFELPKASPPCSPYEKRKPNDRTGVVDLDHFIIGKEEVILAEQFDQQSESEISREDSLSEFEPRIKFDFGLVQARSMRSRKIEHDIFRRIRADPHHHFQVSDNRFTTPLPANHLNNTMKTSSFEFIANTEVVRRTKSVSGKVYTNSNPSNNRF